MMCHNFEEKLVDFQFNTLKRSEYNAMAQHMRECPACLDRYLIQKRAIDLAPSQLKPSYELDKRIKGLVPSRLDSKRSRSYLTIALAASLIGGVFLGLFYDSKKNQSQQAQEIDRFDKNELVQTNFTTT